MYGTIMITSKIINNIILRQFPNLFVDISDDFLPVMLNKLNYWGKVW